MGSEPSFPPISSDDWFRPPNVRSLSHPAEMVDFSAYRDWLLQESNSNSDRCTAARLLQALLPDAATLTNVGQTFNPGYEFSSRWSSLRVSLALLRSHAANFCTWGLFAASGRICILYGCGAMRC